ncbi:hypothetical protein, partial [Escherichia coli]|uniref:hypothetical protein n=1 Tax=Escherichia coli TaxID=562 RepID=UPI001BC8A342
SFAAFWLHNNKGRLTRGCNPTSSKFIHTWLRFGEIMRGSLSAGPASLCKTSGAQLWIDFFPDDGTIDSPGGWHVDIDVILDTLSRMSGD